MFTRLLPQGRFALVSRFVLSYVVFNAMVRFGLLIFNGDLSFLMPQRLIPIFGIGLLFDLAVVVWWVVPLVLLVALWPQRGAGLLRFLAGLLVAIFCGSLAFVAASEFIFWNEFASRFNFIAVDYLIYTREVIGNIRESYDLRPALAGIALFSLLLFASQWRVLRESAHATAPTKRTRLAAVVTVFALPALSFYMVEARYKEFTDETQAVQLAGNGHYEFFSAFRNNELDYATFYRSAPVERVAKELRSEFEHAGKPKFVFNAALPIERDIRGLGPEQHLNVVLISVESLSAEFMTAFGNTEGITPNLDALAKDSLFFTQIYATGLRTVRGLEAITLSIPPTPGNSIVKRPNNGNLFTLGGVFDQRGYESLYLYGGYGYFDNMSAFFGGNGYTVVDRTAIDKKNITYENIWGVADEDLFTLALGEFDKREATGKLFFGHIMTTSNHRPFTYPADRIDIPSGTGRAGAVKYTDWAIGDFIKRARSHRWFDNTVFVILADHTASGRGKTDLPIENFHIPMMIYSPQHIKPAQVATLASQLDVGPTLLSLLNFSYRSHFFGHDIINDGPKHPRAFMANYQTVGYYEDGILVELRPQRRYRLLDATTGKERPEDEKGLRLLDEAVSYYGGASEAYRSGALAHPPKTP